MNKQDILDALQDLKKDFNHYTPYQAISTLEFCLEEIEENLKDKKKTWTY